MVELVTFNAAVPAGADRHRRALLGRVHIAAKALGLEDDDYRAVLRRVTGHASAKDCTSRQLADAIAELERLAGGAPAPRRTLHRPGATHPVAKKARAIWISLYQLGAVASSTERALEAFGLRQLGVDRLQWADQSQGFRLIEALKAIGERHGWDQDVPGRMAAAERIRQLKLRLVRAQLARLAELDVPAVEVSADDLAGWAPEELERFAAMLGTRIRAAIG